RAEHDIDIRALARAQRMVAYVLREPSLAEREHDLREVATDARQRHLGLGVAEARVVLEHLVAVRRAHDAGEDHAAERRPTSGERSCDRPDEFVPEGLR